MSAGLHAWSYQQHMIHSSRRRSMSFHHTKTRREYRGELKQYYWKPYYWSLSCFICTVSDRSTGTDVKYIQDPEGGIHPHLIRWTGVVLCRGIDTEVPVNYEKMDDIDVDLYDAVFYDRFLLCR